MIKNILTALLISTILVGCNIPQAPKNILINSVAVFPTVSYLNIKLDKAGNLPTKHIY